MDNKTIKYVNKDFDALKKSLLEFSKTYFPDTYNDFSEAEPGHMFIEMASYIGDVLSFYTDNQIQENFLSLAENKESIYNLAYMFGYQPRLSYAGSTNLSMEQLVPSITSSSIKYPNLDYALTIPKHTTIKSSVNLSNFTILHEVDFRNTGSVEVNYFNEDYFLLSTSVKALNADIKTVNITVSNSTKFYTTNIIDAKFIKILSITDQNENLWYEVPYLAQSSIMDATSNSNSNIDNVDHILSYKKVLRRFTTRVKPEGDVELQFGSGLFQNNDDEDIIINPNNISLGLVSEVSTLIDTYNPNSFSFTKEYGMIPPNGTVLTISYLSGGGIESNLDTKTLNGSNNIIGEFLTGGNRSSSIESAIRNSLVYYNNEKVSGGAGPDTNEQIKFNTMHAQSAQLRAVSKNDIMLRALTLPPEYGSIAKSYVSSNSNKRVLDLYVLSYDNNKKLQIANTTLKNNLLQYISQYKTSLDRIIIKNAFIINIGIEFSISIDPKFNNNEVLIKSITAIKEEFSTDKMQINKPIIKSKINSLLLKTPGVIAVPDITITNINSDTYSPYSYDMGKATKNNILYPSVDPCIFEIKYPDNDIKGRIYNT